MQHAAEIRDRKQRPLQHTQAKTAKPAVIKIVVLGGREPVVRSLDC
jgi:hypothetical protein